MYYFCKTYLARNFFIIKVIFTSHFYVGNNEPTWQTFILILKKEFIIIFILLLSLRIPCRVLYTLYTTVMILQTHMHTQKHVYIYIILNILRQVRRVVLSRGCTLRISFRWSPVRSGYSVVKVAVAELHIHNMTRLYVKIQIYWRHFNSAAYIKTKIYIVNPIAIVEYKNISELSHQYNKDYKKCYCENEKIEYINNKNYTFNAIECRDNFRGKKFTMIVAKLHGK